MCVPVTHAVWETPPKKEKRAKGGLTQVLARLIGMVVSRAIPATDTDRLTDLSVNGPSQTTLKGGIYHIY